MKPPTTGERIRRCSICGGTIDGGSFIGTGDGSMTANNGLGSFAHADCYRIEELRQALATANARAEKAERERDAAIADEREACAKVAADYYNGHGKTFGTPRSRDYEHAGRVISAAIRTRGNTQ